MQILPPSSEENFGLFSNYINKVNTLELLKGLEDDQEILIQKMLSLDEATLNYQYQPNKWTIKEVVGHVIDTERIFAYRALRFARQDNTPLAGYDEVLYGDTSNAGQRTIQDLLEEFTAVRKATITLFKSFNEKMLEEKGVASSFTISVRGLGYAILGHCTHHLQIIDERYLRN